MGADFTRRSLATGIGRAGLSLGGLALLAPKASADTPFTAFGFHATGAPASRTMPDRLGDIKNVVDFGADPTGNGDSRAAIQAAVDSVAGAGRGIVYFPLGFYQVSSPGISLNYNGALSICFRGESTGSTLSANFAGYVFDRHLVSPNNTAGIISFEKLNIQNGNASGGSGGVRLGSTNLASFRDLNVSGFTCVTTEDSPGNSSQNILFDSVKFQPCTSGAGSRGLIIGGSGAMLGCDFVGAEIAVVAYGNGFNMAGNRIENCGIAYQLGLDSAGTNRGMSGFSLSGSTEGNLTCVDMAGTCTGGFIGPLGMLGHSTSGPNQDTPSHYGLLIRADCAQACTFYGVATQQFFDTAGIAIASASARANNVFITCQSSFAFGGGLFWSLPTNAYTAQFLQSNIQPIWTFSQLPSGGNVLEGDEFNISDSDTATWGATAAGGGSNHVSVRYNGSNWTVVGR